MNKKFVIDLFNELCLGNGSVVNDSNINRLNEIALDIYNKSELNSDEIETLKYLIMSCNILYNRTDMTILPIEDGFYDLLFEKYKNYDANFQVGSAVVEFKESFINDQSDPKKVAIQPLSFIDKPERNELRQKIYEELSLKNKQILNKNDFHISPLIFDQETISKRKHDTEHNHPDLVGTLDKCKFVLNKDAIDAGCFNDTNVKVLERDFFQDHINKGIIKSNQEIEVVCELKYDGISVEADCGLELISARTRGDTGIGAAADITPILQGYPFRQAGPMIGEEPLGVKFEAIITKSNLDVFNTMREKAYRNCRTAIVGLFGSSDGYMFRDLITLIPLAVDREQTPWIKNRIEEIHFINSLFRSHGEPLRYCYFKGTVQEVLYCIKQFLDEAKTCRDYFNFMYDGIVVSYLDENIRQQLGRKNYINKYSMAVKFDPLEKQTIVRGITYEVGQHGQVTPMIHYDPVEFIGTIHTKSTGSSLKRFNELDLKYGDYINIKYINDVMPYVSKLDNEHNRNNPNNKFEFTRFCPICGTLLTTSSSGDTAICPNRECPARNRKRMVNMFSKLNIKGFAEASFESLKDITNFYQLYMKDEEFYINRLGDADGRSFYQNLQNMMKNKIKDYIFMGSLGFTGIAHKKWKSIFEKVTLQELYYLWKRSDSIESFNYAISNFMSEGITKDTIANEFSIYANDINFVIENNMIIDTKGNGTAKKQIRFSGVRNLQLMQQLNTNGYDADEGSVTKKTDILLIPYEGFSSTKVNKALNQDNTIVVPINEFIENTKKYLGETIIF